MKSFYNLNLDRYVNKISSLNEIEIQGQVEDVEGSLIKGYLPGACMRGMCEIFTHRREKKLLAEIIGFQGEKTLFMPLGEIKGVSLGSKILLSNQKNSIKIGDAFIGRIINCLGEPIDGKGKIEANDEEIPLYGSGTINPLNRSPVNQPLNLGIRAIDALLTVGKGQRIGIFSGSGVGKSVLLGMISKLTHADLNVIALIGERGREVREFIEYKLGKKGLSRSIVIVATSDQSPLMRVRGAFFATAIAEYFSKKKLDILLTMDSITRFAMAQREIGLSAREAPGLKGYTPSVFSLLPQLVERAGSFENQGSITGLYSVLIEGDDVNDPIGDTVRSIVDGHIVLDRKLAQRGHFPAIDVLSSVSRVMSNVVSMEHRDLAHAFRETLAVYKDAKDLIQIGAYKAGSDKKTDKALRLIEPITNFLRQKENETSTVQECFKKMKSILEMEKS